MEVRLGPGHIVLDGDPTAPPQEKGGHNLPFSVHVCCGQTAGWIKMPLVTKVGLGPGYIVLHGDPASLRKWLGASVFGPCLLWPNGGMDKDGTLHGGLEVGLGPGHNMLDGDPATLPKRGLTAHFRSISIVAKRLMH